MRLIDADELKSHFPEPSQEMLISTYNHLLGLFAALDFAPSVDAIPVVRCKDCAYLSNDHIAPEWNRICRKLGCGKAESGFCDEGERRTDGT